MLRDKVLARIGEIEAEIAAKRKSLDFWMRSLNDPAAEGIRLEDEIRDLVRRRDLLLGSLLLEVP